MALDVDVLAQDIADIKNIVHSGGGIDNTELSQLLAKAIIKQIKLGDVIVAGGSSAGTYKVT